MSVRRRQRHAIDARHTHHRHLAPDVETVFLTPAATLQSVSSTLIREISQLGGDVAPYVAPMVLERLQQKRAARG